MEYERSNGMCDDPFAEVHDVKPTWNCVEETGKWNAEALKMGCEKMEAWKFKGLGG